MTAIPVRVIESEVNEMDVAVKVFMVAVGIVLFAVNLVYMSKRKMRPSIGVVWSVLALIAVVAGVILRMDMLERYMSWKAVIAAMLGAAALVVGFYVSALNISELRNQSQELFMQVVLLNEENSRLRKAAEKQEKEEQLRLTGKRP